MSTYVDLTTFTEVDPSNHWSQSTLVNTGTGVYRGWEDSYVYKDYGVDNFGEYEHLFDINITGYSGAGEIGFWAVTNSPAAYEDLSTGQYIRAVHNSSAGTYDLYLHDAGNSNYDNTTGYALSDSTYYFLKVVRVGTTVTCKIYPSASDRTNDTNVIDTLTITGQNTKFRYIQCGMAGGGGSGGETIDAVSGYFQIKTLNIQNIINADTDIHGTAWKYINTNSCIYNTPGSEVSVHADDVHMPTSRQSVVKDNFCILHAVWAAKTGSNYIVYYAQSSDFGVTWNNGEGGGPGTVYTVYDAGTGHRNQDVSIDVDSNGNVFISWVEHNITVSTQNVYFRRRLVTEGWQSTFLLSNGGFSRSSVLCVDNRDNIHVIIEKGTNAFHYVSTNTGTSFTNSQILGSSVGGRSVDFDDNSNLYIYDPGNSQIHKGTIIPGSPDTWSWSTFATLFGGGYSWYGKLIIDENGYIHAFGQNDGSSDLKHTYWNGISWSSETIITSSFGSGDVGHLSLSSIALKIRVVFETSGGAGTTYYKDWSPSTGWSTLSIFSFSCNQMGMQYHAGLLGSWIGMIYKGSAKFTALPRPPEERIISSYAIIRKYNVQQTVDSNGKIVYRSQKNIISAAEIYSTIHNIISDSHIFAVYKKYISATAKIVGQYQYLLSSFAYIKHLNLLNTINSSANIAKTSQSNINTDTLLSNFKDFYGKLRALNSSLHDFYTQLKVNQVTPVDPTGLTAVDPLTGESIILSWTDTGNYGYNVYKQTGITWTKQNDIVITGNSYVVGSLAPDITYTFKVMGVNGIGIESTGITISGTSAPSDTTPNYDISHYKNPDFLIKINGTHRTDAVLERVELVYGEEFSTAHFFIPKRPNTTGLPGVEGQTVTVFINSRLVFTGYLTKRTDIWSASSLRSSYIAVSTLWDLTKTTVGFNVARPPEIPKEVWSPEAVACMTPLEFMSYRIRYMGNYRIYTSPTGSTSFYRIGSPITRRNYLIGKHIIEQNTYEDVTDEIGSVTVYSNPIQLTSYTYYYSSQANVLWGVWNSRRYTPSVIDFIKKDVNGEYYLEFHVHKTNVSNIKVFAKTNSPPEVTEFLKEPQVLPAHCKCTPGYISMVAASLGEQSCVDINEGKGIPDSRLSCWPNGGKEARFPVYKYQSYPTTWKSISASIEYESEHHAIVKVAPLPAAYIAFIKEYIAVFPVKDEDTGKISNEEIPVRFMWDPLRYIPSVVVVYTYQGNKNSHTVSGGSGSSRCLQEGISPYSVSLPSFLPYQIDPSSNVGVVSSYLSQKASAEYERLSQSKYRGTITVLGDETLDLRTHVNGMEVAQITHEFTPESGFLTHIDLTKERFYRGEVVFKDKQAKEVSTSTTKNKSYINTLYYNFKKIENIVGLNDKPETTTDPDANIGYWSK